MLHYITCHLQTLLSKATYYLPSTLCSLNPMFPQTYVPSTLCSLNLMFPQICVPSTLYSLRPMFPQPYISSTLYVPSTLCSLKSKTFPTGPKAQLSKSLTLKQTTIILKTHCSKNSTNRSPMLNIMQNYVTGPLHSQYLFLVTRAWATLLFPWY